MKTYRIEGREINAKTKSKAVDSYLDDYFEIYMRSCDKSFATLYKLAVQIN